MSSFLTFAQTRLPFQVYERSADGAASDIPSETVILLHGFRESGSSILRRLAPAIPEHCRVLAPDAPFPQVLDRADGGRKLAFSWYFYDPDQDQYLLDMEVAKDCVLDLIEEKIPGTTPITLIGFSMGGYLAPFVAAASPRVTRVIGIGCRFLDEELEGQPRPFELHGIHGAQDDRVDPEKSQASHARLISRGWRGSYARLEGVGHRITDEVQTEVSRFFLR